MDNLQNNTLITVGIPFYNDERFMALAIDSVVKQTYKDWVLLLIDDGSTDNSLRIAKEYEKKDTRIKVYSDGKNKNLANRLNQIIDLADTKYIARMDADDIMAIDRLQIQLEIMESNPNIDILGTNAYSIDESNNILGVRSIISNELIDVEGFVHPSILVKTQWAKNNKYDSLASRMQDFLLWQKTKDFSCFKMIKIPLLFYREVGYDYSKKYKKTVLALKNIYIHEENIETKKRIRKIYCNNYLKMIVYIFFNFFGLEFYLLKRRNIKLNIQQLNLANNNIKKIIN